jgi:adenosine kinase
MSKRSADQTADDSEPTPTEHTETEPKKMKSNIKKLLGIGNPLLDISVNVDMKYLEDHKIKLGNATLAGPDDLIIYKEIVEKPDVLYIAGGATQNSIRGAQWLIHGEKVTHYIGSVGDDENAKKLKNAAENDNVQTHYYVSKKNPTGCCACLVVNNERSLVANLGAANDYVIDHYHSEEIQQLIKTIDVFYSAGYFLTVSPDTAVEIGKHCVEHNKVLVWGVAAPFIIDVFWDRVERILPYVDYIVANETEAQKIIEKLNLQSKDMESSMKAISELPKENQKRKRTIIFTHGPDPVHVYSEGKYCTFPVPPIEKSKIVDTNGAGDAFLGGFLAGLIQDKSLEECVKAGLYTAQHILQVSGTQYQGFKSDFV